MIHQIKYAKLTTTPAFVRPEKKSYFYIDQNIQLFIDLYNEKERYFYGLANKHKEELRLKSVAFKNKECQYCGGELRYIVKFDFWGCSNFRLQGKHSSFDKFEPNFYNHTVNVSNGWISEIIKESGFKGKVKAKELFEFYENAGYEDMRTKFGFESTENLINRYTKVKRRSAEQEKECLNFLKRKYPKVLFQQCITYKLKDSKESFCIPDFICSDGNSVYVIDAKLDFTDDDKMDLYVGLVRFIMNEKKDKRIIFGAHIISKESTCINDNSRYALINIEP